MTSRLLVTVADLSPGAALDAAVALADALDARRVPSTLLTGPHPHPEVVAWVVARRDVGDATLLHGVGERARAHRRLPAHEAGLRLTAAIRSRDALGVPVDGYAPPYSATDGIGAASEGMRRALALGGVDLLVDTEGAHRLGPGGAVADSRRGTVSVLGAPASRHRRLRTRRRTAGAPAPLVHLALSALGPRAAALDAVDAALEAGALPGTPATLLPPRRGAATGRGPDPEFWSITA